MAISATRNRAWSAAFLGWARDPGGIATLVLGVYAVLFALWVAFRWGPPAARVTIGDLAFLPMGVAAVALAWRAARLPRLSAPTRRAWTLLGAAFAATLAGDLLWAYYEVGRGAAPSPSAADGAYLLFYPLVLAGLTAFPASPQTPAQRTAFWLDAVTVLLGGWMVVWYVALGPVALASGASRAEKMLSAAYPIGDLVLIFGIAAVMLRRPAEGSQGALGILAAAVVLFLAGDLSFGYLSLAGRYTSGAWPDALWMLAQFGFAVSAHYQHWRSTRRDPGHPAPVDPHHVSPLPYAAIAVGYLILILAARNATLYPLGGTLVGAIAITTIVGTRQLLLLRDLRAAAATDGLTGLPTRQHFSMLAEREFARAARYRRPLAALLVDVDGFKMINDRFGHPVGDEVLRLVARRLREAFRQIDLVGRYGGDEFVAILPECTAEAAVAAAQRFVGAVAGSSLVAAGQTVSVTVSVGVATADGPTTLAGLLRRADEALYQAKRAGRDRVVLFAPAAV